MQIKVCAIHILGPVRFFQQGASRQVFEPRPWVSLNHAVVVEIVFGRLKERAGDIFVIRGQFEDHIQIFQQF